MKAVTNSSGHTTKESIVSVDDTHKLFKKEDRKKQSDTSDVEEIPLLNTTVIITSLVEHLAMLLVFGLSYPLLGIVIMISFCSLSLMWQSIIFRYINFMIKSGNIGYATRQLNKATENLPRMSLMSTCVLISIPTTSMISLLNVDMSSDSRNNFSGSAGVILVTYVGFVVFIQVFIRYFLINSSVRNFRFAKLFMLQTTAEKEIFTL